MSSTGNSVQRTFEQQLVRWRSGEAPQPTVTSVATGAAVSRSSLYRFHPLVVARIHGLRGDLTEKKHTQLHMKITVLATQLKTEKALSSALARACAELAAANTALKEQLEDERLRFELRLQHLEKQLRGRRNVRLLDST